MSCLNGEERSKREFVETKLRTAKYSVVDLEQKSHEMTNELKRKQQQQLQQHCIVSIWTRMYIVKNLWSKDINARTNTQKKLTSIICIKYKYMPEPMCHVRFALHAPCSLVVVVKITHRTLYVWQHHNTAAQEFLGQINGFFFRCHLVDLFLTLTLNFWCAAFWKEVFFFHVT